LNNKNIQPYVIDGRTGELDVESFGRFNDNINVPMFSSKIKMNSNGNNYNVADQLGYNDKVI
jgi:hypothetical protein